MLDGVYIFNDPLGTVLVMGAWNYPLQLTLVPAAAGMLSIICYRSTESLNISSALKLLLPEIVLSSSQVKWHQTVPSLWLKKYQNI